jgi:hypothetical protein
MCRGEIHGALGGADESGRQSIWLSSTVPADDRPGSTRPAADAAAAPVLGYLFWHAPGPTVDRSAYEEAIGRWHRALADAPPAGFEQSWTWRLAPPPWLAARPAPLPYDQGCMTDWLPLSNRPISPNA